MIHFVLFKKSLLLSNVIANAQVLLQTICVVIHKTKQWINKKSNNSNKIEILTDATYKLEIAIVRYLVRSTALLADVEERAWSLGNRADEARARSDRETHSTRRRETKQSRPSRHRHRSDSCPTFARYDSATTLESTNYQKHYCTHHNIDKQTKKKKRKRNEMKIPVEPTKCKLNELTVVRGEMKR